MSSPHRPPPRLLWIHFVLAAFGVGAAACQSTTQTGNSASCLEGELTCPCFTNGTCGDDLECISGVCVRPDNGGAGGTGTAGSGGNTTSGGTNDSGGSAGSSSMTGASGGAVTGGSGGSVSGRTGGVAGTGGGETGGGGTGTGGTAPCAPLDAIRCAGHVPQVCALSGWVNQPVCGGTTPRCVTDVGCACEQTARRCRDGNTPEVCNAAGVWVAQPDCPTATPACETSTGRCVCTEGMSECDPATRTERACVSGAWQSTACTLGCGSEMCISNTVAVAGRVACDVTKDLYCTTPGEVCLHFFNPSRSICGPASQAADSKLACDGPGDCPTGQDCCKNPYGPCNSYCASSGTCHLKKCYSTSVDLALCDPDAPTCTSGRTCKRTADWVNGASGIPLYACDFWP